MRLMLGDDQNNPMLLVDVEDDYDPKDFEFTVINGAWEGAFKDEVVTAFDRGKVVNTMKLRILTDNQNRLRSKYGDYNTVFDNFHNPNYVAPRVKVVRYDDDDDIPF